MKTNCAKYLLLCGVALLTLSCRKELTFEPEEIIPGYRMAFDIDWLLQWETSNNMDWSGNWDRDLFDGEYDDFQPRKPEGFGVVLYDLPAEDFVYNREQHLSSTGSCRVSLDDSTRALLFYSDDSEYITVSGLQQPHTAYASTNSRTRSGFVKLHSEEKTVSPPDILYGAYMEIDNLQYVEGYQSYKLNFKPLVYGYVIRFAIDANREYIARARGALAGMAEGIYIKDGKTSDTAATLLFDCDLKNYGVGAMVTTFGIPGHSLEDGTRYAGNPNRRYDVNLEILLKNGKTLNYDFDVTDQVARQPRGGVIFLENIEIPDEVAKEPNSGFYPDVEDWGDMIDVAL